MAIFGFYGVPAGAVAAADLDIYGNRSAGREGFRTPTDKGQGISTVWAPSLASESGVTVAVQGRPRLRNGSTSITPHPNPAFALLHAYRTSGEDFLADVLDNFALAIIDANANRVILAIDRMGMERLAYHVAGKTVYFSTSAIEIAQCPGIQCSVRRQAIFDYLMVHMVPAPQTIFEGIEKLRAATCLTIDAQGARLRRYWNPTFVDRGQENFEELSSALHTSLADAVVRCQPDDRTGAFLSGGLDSTTVVGKLAQVTKRSPRTFSIGFGVQEYNELEYARIAARHFNVESVEYDLVPGDIIDAIPRVAAAYDEPFGNSSAVPTYACARVAAQHGITHLLAGDGGDEIFGGNKRYAQQKVFELYRTIPDNIRLSVIEPLSDKLSSDSKLTLLRKFKSYVDQARIPMPDRLEYWNFMYRSDMKLLFADDFRESVDHGAPLRNMRSVYKEAPTDNLLHQMLFYDWQYTLADNDLRKVNTMCELAGVRVSYPMLDSDVVEMSVRIPADSKIRGQSLRAFFKRSMSNFLPREILEKTKHGFGLPFGVWLKTEPLLADFVYGLLNDLKSRRIVRGSFIDQLIDEHRSGHPSYFGYAIWDLALLEAWFQAHNLSLQ